MKLFVITLSFLIAFSSAEFAPFILFPDFLIETAREHKALAQNLQNDFDKAYINANGILSDLLGSTSKTRLVAFRNHSDVLLKIYDPAVEALDILPLDDCRSHIAIMLQATIGMGGSSGTSCMKNFYTRAKQEADAAVANVAGLNENYIKLSQFVYQSFSQKNALLDAEEITQEIKAIYDKLANSLQVDVIDKDEFEAELKSLEAKHNDCLANTESQTRRLIAPVNDQIEVCKNIHDINNVRAASFSAPRSSNPRGFKSYMSEFENAKNSFENYEW